MTRKIALIAFLAVALLGCNNDDDSTPVPVDDVTVQFTFTHNWDGDAIESTDYDLLQYFNANGEQMSISKLVYLISDVVLINGTTGEKFEPGDYNLIDARQGTNLTFTPNAEIPPGDYLVSFTFGFDDEDNQDGVYPDLNSADGGWNVPMMLGGGYHYMRLEGKYIDNNSDEVGYQFHTIRANDKDTTPITLQDTSFEVDLGVVTIGDNTNIEVEMNVAEWFKNPNQWDLNVLFTVLMPNFDAQIQMFENGSTFSNTTGVFSKGTVTQ